MLLLIFYFPAFGYQSLKPAKLNETSIHTSCKLKEELVCCKTKISSLFRILICVLAWK